MTRFIRLTSGTTLCLQAVYIAIHKPCKDIKPRYHITQAVMGTRDNIIINSLYYIGRSIRGDVVYMVIEYILVGDNGSEITTSGTALLKTYSIIVTKSW
jgi:hypothetical protein